MYCLGRMQGCWARFDLRGEEKVSDQSMVSFIDDVLQVYPLPVHGYAVEAAATLELAIVGLNETMEADQLKHKVENQDVIVKIRKRGENKKLQRPNFMQGQFQIHLRHLWRRLAPNLTNKYDVNERTKQMIMRCSMR